MAVKGFIADKNTPVAAIKTLQNFGEIMLFITKNITYRQVAGHSDLFFCFGNGQCVTAPNTPKKYIEWLKEKNVDIITGSQPVGNNYPSSAIYNAVVTDDYLIHNLSVTDPVVLETFSHLKKINIRQGYSRCSLLPLKNNHFITSDEGVYKVLETNHLDALYVNPSSILLPGFKHGFFGGTAGVIDDTIFLTGSLNYFPEGEKVRNYLNHLHYTIIELYDGPLFDIGSLLIV